MQTKVVKCFSASQTEAAVREAAQLLRQGRPVVFPTETVYGVGASAASGEAVERLRAVKGRPDGKPFTVHVATPADAAAYVETLPRVAARFMQKTWPGPLTLILDAPREFDPQVWRERAPAIAPPIPELVYHEGAVGLRCPANEAARLLLGSCGVPVVASSANQFGHEPPLDAAQALRDLDGKVPLVLDGGPTRYTAASTIVRVSGEEWTVVREGVWSERYLRKILTTTLLFICTGNTCRSPMAEALAKVEAARRLGCRVDELESRHAVSIQSAGVFAPPGREASPEARLEASNRGGDLEGHRTMPLSVERIREADAIYCMTRMHREAVLALAAEAGPKTVLLDPDDREIEDPMGSGPEVYRRCADQIEAAVRKRMEERFA